MSVTAEPNSALAVSREDAADRLGVSLQTFKRHVQPQLRTIRAGRRVLVPLSSLQSFVAGTEATAA